MAPDIWVRFRERFAIPTIREFYGSTEGNAFMCNLTGEPGMVGRLPRGQILVEADPETGELLRNREGRCERVEVGGTGLLLGKISPLLSFEGYLDRKATKKKIVEGVLKPGDRYFNSGDLLQLHPGGWLSFSDRLGDTYRWKGENVSTGEVAEVLRRCAGVEDANVYGVAVPGCEGKAGMAAISVGDDFEVACLSDWVRSQLAPYQRPVFLRLLSDEMQLTGTFKQRKGDYREQGFDLDAISDSLYLLEGDEYVPLDRERFDLLRAGDLSF